MLNIQEEKKALRKQIKSLKAGYSLSEKKEKSLAILQQLEQLEAFQKAECVLLYWSMDDEVHTHDFAQQLFRQKQVILPTVVGDQLVLKQFEGIEKMVAGPLYGIPEPAGEALENPERIDFIVVPGVAFDREKNRMGRGKAYYDKTLRNLNAFKAGICFDFQLSDKVPSDALDVKMDAVIAESEAIM